MKGNIYIFIYLFIFCVYLQNKFYLAKPVHKSPTISGKDDFWLQIVFHNMTRLSYKITFICVCASITYALIFVTTTVTKLLLIFDKKKMKLMEGSRHSKEMMERDMFKKFFFFFFIIRYPKWKHYELHTPSLLWICRKDCK